MGAMVDEEDGNFVASEKGGPVKGGVPGGVRSIGVGPIFEQESDAIFVTSEDRPGEEREAVLVFSIWAYAVLEMTSQQFVVSLADGYPKFGVGRGGRDFGVFANDGDSDGERDEGDPSQGQGKENAFQAMKNELGEAATAPEHGGEVAADEEEEGHTEAMNGVLGRSVVLVLIDVLGRPDRDLEEGEESVQHNPKEHRARAEGVEMVVAGGRALHGVILLRRGFEGQVGSRLFLIGKEEKWSAERGG